MCARSQSAEPGELLVLPRVEPVIAAGTGAGGARASALAGLETGTASSQIDARAIELEVDGLRAYRDGSPASRIHWAAVARTGELFERNLVAGADAAPLVVLDATQPASPAGARRRGSRRRLAVRAPRRRRRLRRAAPRRPPPDRDRNRHARLGRRYTPALRWSRRAPRRRRCCRRCARARSTWSAPGPRRRIPASMRGGSGTRFLVTPEASWTGAATFTVAGCVGRRVGRAQRRAGGARGMSEAAVRGAGWGGGPARGPRAAVRMRAPSRGAMRRARTS